MVYYCLKNNFLIDFPKFYFVIVLKIIKKNVFIKKLKITKLNIIYERTQINHLILSLTKCK